MCSRTRPTRSSLSNGLIAELKKFYYHLAGADNVGVVAPLKESLSSDKILFGTDFPPGGRMLETAQTIRELKIFTEADLKLIDRDNAVRLMPRLKG
jgi:predicted TIM-barrel fold metal-dependent hydrolase